jgi:predicted transcriptional regulator
MINTTDIISAWQRIGWNEPSKTGYTSILDTDNKTSLSGLKFDALHALANFVTVKDTYADSSVSSAAINAVLKAWQQNSIVEVATDVFRAEEKVEQGVLLKDRIDFSQLESPNGLFVGWKIVVPEGYVLTIKSVELLFDTVATFNLYVFNTSQLAAITALTTSATTVANSVKIITPTTAWNLYGKSSSYKSGTYYVGYIQATAKAVMRNFHGVNSICRFVPIQATANGTSLPAYSTVAETGYTHGMNLDYVIRKDFTNDYLNNVDLFDRAIGISVICKLLEQIHFSPRINQSERASKEGLNNLSAKAFLDLNGTAEENPEIPYKRGLLREYQDEVRNIRERIYKKNKLIVTTIK